MTDVTATSVNLQARISPNGPSTTYRFEFVTQEAFEKSGYADAKMMPPSGEAPLGSGTKALSVVQPLIAPLNPLTPATTYHYRAVATNSEGTTTAPERLFTTRQSGQAPRLPDDRGWEMVSPVDKGGGAVAAPEAFFGGGDFQAAAAGGAVTYGSGTAFGGSPGASPQNQYLSRRGQSGWDTQSVSPPLESAAYGDEPDGAPYRLFSTDLSRALLFGGLPCRGALPGCPAPNPVLPGSGAPAGYMAYYLREGSSGTFASLLSEADLKASSVSPEAFEVSFVAATPDLSHQVLSSCAKLTASATEVVNGGKCDPEEANLYEHSAGGLSLVNLLPGAATGAADARIAAPLGAISGDGSRVYWVREGNLYLRTGSATVQVDDSIGGGTSFEAASADGSVAFLTKGGHLYRFLAATNTLSDLTPAGGVVGVLGISASGSTVYFQDGSGIERWREGASELVAPGGKAAASSDYPPASATARVSADGEHLAFISGEELTGYDNRDGDTGKPDDEVYLYGPLVAGGVPHLVCVSCNPTGERPQGRASIPGALVNGTTRAYRPRALSASGPRLFFDTADDIGEKDTNGERDVYQWEAEGVGDCQRSPGCLSLLSSGHSHGGARFIDASNDGADAYFVTDGSLVGADHGSVDLYDARAGGGFPEAPTPTPCIGDACQALPTAPEDPDPGTQVGNSGNPRFHLVKQHRKKRKRHRRHGGRSKAQRHEDGGRAG